MRINFRQGIISAQDTFLHYTGGGNVSLLTDNRPFTVTIADKSSNYVHSEGDTVLDAWEGPFVGGVDYWLYMEFDPTTFTRTFGWTTVEPKAQPSQPPAVLDQMWYNTDTNEQFVNIGVAYARTYRVLVARLNSTVFHSLSINGPSDFTGTQVGNTTSVLAGRILFTEFGKTIKRDDGTFLTSEDQFFTNQSQVVGVRLESNITRSKSAAVSLAQFQVVALQTGGTMVSANYADTENSILAIVTEDVLLGEVGNVIVQGTVTNPAWDFSTFPAGTRLWVRNGELTTADPYEVDQPNNPEPMVPVAKVMTQDTVIFLQGLGGVGPKGESGGGSGSVPAATTTSLGTVYLSTPPANPSIPTVVTTNDPILSGAPFASGVHGHAGTEISISPSGTVTEANAQLAIVGLDTKKLALAGGTMTGTLVLNADPVNALDAATKQYVDASAGGGSFVDLTTNQSVAGEKTFTDEMFIDSNNKITFNQFATVNAHTMETVSGEFQIHGNEGFFGKLGVSTTVSNLSAGQAAPNRVQLEVQHSGVRKFSFTDLGNDPIFEWQLGGGIAGEEDVIMARRTVKAPSTVVADDPTVLTTKDFVDAKVTALKQFSMPMAFVGVQPNATEIFKIPVNVEMTFNTADNALNNVIATVAPSGGTATWTVSRNDIVVGNITLADGVTSGSVVWIANTVFAVNDKFSIESVVLNGASDMSVNFYGFKSAIV